MRNNVKKKKKKKEQIPKRQKKKNTKYKYLKKLEYQNQIMIRPEGIGRELLFIY